MNISKSTWALSCILMALLITAGAANAAAKPPNDNCANATAIEEVVNMAFDTTYATFDGPGLRMTSANIWYRYTATCTGNVTVSLCGSHYDTKLVVYSGTGCYPTLSRLLAYNDDSCNLQSEVSFAATAGSQYLIEVGGYSSYKGQGVLTIRCPVQPCKPANDNCANAQAIGNVTNLAFNTNCATFDGPGDCVTGPNIWYCYTAPCTGQATVSLCGSSFDTVLSIYDGCQCPPQTRLKCNDDACGQQSQVTLNVIAGNRYLIEVGGFGSNQKGQGLLSVSCSGEMSDQFDLGDAPDNSNNFSRSMTAYPEPTPVTARYPTVFIDGSGAGPYGPVHTNPQAVAHLGSTVSLESEADNGWDQDGINNISPLTNGKNQDRGDDGVVVPINMPNCGWTTFDYTVKVLNPGTDLWINVWCDFNRDGDWNDDSSTNPEMASSKGIVSEWAVQNQYLFGLPTGLNYLTTPAFLSWHPKNGPGNVWMRITISEQPWKGGSGTGGSGPQSGYQFGETEDYYFIPNTICSICEDLNNDGLININDLWMYMDQWLQYCQ